MDMNGWFTTNKFHPFQMKDNIYWRHEETMDDEIKNNNKGQIEKQVLEDDKDSKERERPKGFEDLKVWIYMKFNIFIILYLQICIFILSLRKN